MSKNIEVTGYNLTLIPQLQDGEVSKEFDAQDFGRLMRDSIFLEQERRVISVRDQLSLTFQPPTVVVMDHSDEQPFRQSFLVLAKAVIEILGNLGLSIVAYGWNISGRTVPNSQQKTLDSLANRSRIDSAVELAGGGNWLIPELQIVVNSPISDRTSVGLHFESGEDSVAGIRFTLNAHFDRPLSTSKLEEEGSRIWIASGELVGSLIQ